MYVRLRQIGESFQPLENRHNLLAMRPGLCLRQRSAGSMLVCIYFRKTHCYYYMIGCYIPILLSCSALC